MQKLNKALDKDNLLYVLAEKSIRILYSLFLGALMYRQLGVESTGLLSILLTYFALMQFISAGGLNELNVVNLKSSYIERDAYIISTYYVQLIYSVLVSILMVLYLWGEFHLSILLILVFAVLIRFNNINKSQLEVASNWRGIFFRELMIVSILVLHRAIGIYLNFGLTYFFSGILIESFIFLLVYGVNIKSFGPQIRQVWDTLKSGIPILFQGFITLLIMKADMLTVTQRFSSYDAGIYSVGIKISEALYFLPMAVGIFVLPALLNHNRKHDLKNIQLYIVKFLKYGIPLVLLLIFVSEKLILGLFGGKFLTSIDIFRVHIVSLLFVLVGVLGDKYYLIKKRTDILFLKTLLSGLAYVASSYFLVKTPFHLALAVLGFQFMNGVVVDVFFKEGRKLLRFKLNALILRKS